MPILGGTCREPDCFKPARRNGYCWGHHKRRMRRQVVSTPLAERPVSTWDRLTAAALAYADVGDSEGDYDRAQDRLRKAAMAYGDRVPQPMRARRRTKPAWHAQLELPLTGPGNS